MPDFGKLLETLKGDNQAIQQGQAPEENQEQEAQANLFGENKPLPQENQQQAPVSNEQMQQSASVAANAEVLEADQFAQQSYGGFADASAPTEIDPNSWSADEVYKNFFAKSGDNVMFGVGTMIGSLGDVAQAVGGLTTGDWEGNSVSKLLQEAGEQTEQQWTGYVPEEMLDPEFKVSTFMNPAFWSTHGARFVPQLLEIIATYGASAGIKKGLQYGAKKILKGKIDDVARATTRGVHTGSDVVQEVAGTGKGWVGKIMTDQGTFTKKFGNLIETTAAGSLTNLRVSLANAGEMYNTYSDMKDEEGNLIFNKEELGEMSSGAFSNNMAYIGMDILSWGMTFGKGSGMLRNFGINSSKIGKKATTNVSKLYARNVSPIFRKSGALAAKMTKEGMEEQVQESFEEWSKIEAYRDQFGTIDGYQGKVSKEYGRGGLLSSGFMDYLTSHDSEAIRTIAFGVGAMAGGAFNVKSIVNKGANDARQMINRTENLRTQFEDGTKGKEYQRKHIYSQIAELIYDDKTESFGGFIQSLQESGVVNDEEMAHYEKAYDKMAETNDEVAMLDIMGKKAFMNNVVSEIYYTESMGIEQEASDRRIKTFEKNIKTPEVLERKIAQEKANLETIQKGLAYKLGKIQENKENLFQNKKAEHNVDDGTTEMKNGDVTPESRSNVNEDDLSTKEMSFYEKAKAGLKKGVENLFGNKEQTTSEQIVDEDGDVSEGLDPKTYATEVKEGDRVSVDGRKATVTNVNQNVEGTAADNFDYQFDVEKGRENTAITAEELGNLKGNMSITKANTFYTDRTGKNHNVQKLSKPKKSESTSATPEEGAAKIGRRAVAKDDREYSKESSMIYDDDDTTEVTKEVYKDFVDTGETPTGVIKSILEKIINGETLTLEEQSIYDYNSTFMEDALVKINSQTSIDSEINKIENESEKKVAEKQGEIRNEAGVTKTLAQEKEDNEKAAEENEKKASEAQSTKEKVLSEVDKLKSKIENAATPKQKAKLKKELKKLQGELRKATRILNRYVKTKNISKAAQKASKSIFSKFKNVIDSFTDFADETDAMTDEDIDEARNENSNNINKNVKKVAEKGKSLYKMLLNFANKLYRITFSALGSDKGFNLARTMDPTNGWFETAELMTVNEKIGQMFPDVMPRAYTMDNLQKGIGVKGIGYSLASAIFIQDNKWNQGEVFMHELSHVYYALTKEDAVTKSLLNLAMRDKKLVEQIKKNYDDEIFFGVVSDGGVATKRELLGPDYDNMTQIQRDEAIALRVQAGELKVIPDMNQPVITEEAFVAKLEGDLNKEYSKLFDKNDTFKAQYLSKKWWGKLKKRAVEAKRDFSGTEDSFLKTLNRQEQTEYNTSKNYILDQFGKVTKGVDVSANGRAKRILADKLTKEADIMQIATERIENQNEHIGNPEKANEFDKMLLREEQESAAENIDNNVQEHDSDATFQKDALKFVTKASKLINRFNANYGLSLAKRFHNENKGKIVNWNKMPIYDGDLLKIKLKDMANFAVSADEFIYMLESSEFDEVFSFNEFLDETRNDKQTFLAGLWHLNRNTEFVNGVKLHVNSNGTVKIESGMNFKEQTQYENTLGNVLKHTGRYFKGKLQKGVSEEFDAYKNAADNIRTGTFTDFDIAQVLKFFSPKGTDIQRIIKKGVVNMGGKQHTVDNFVYGFLSSKEGIGGKPGQQMDSMTYTGKWTSPLPAVRNFVQAIIATNRPFTAEYTIVDANGNLKPAQQVNNALLNGVKNMNRDALEMPLNSFLRKYAHHTKGLRKASGEANKPVNDMLVKLYNDAQSGKPMALNTYDGVVNQQTKSSSTLKNSNAIEQSINEFTMFLASEQEYGKSQGSYLMDLGRFADSPRAFVMEVPKHNQRKLFTTNSNGKVVLRANNPSLRSSYTVAKKSGYNGSYQKYLNDLTKDAIAEVRFINNNSDIRAKLSTMNDLMQNNKLTPKGALKVFEYTINQHINQMNFNEVFKPSYKNDAVLKRGKGVTSPYFRMPENVKMEAIPIVDSELEGQKLDDGAMYMLSEDIERVSRLGGNVMPLGKGIKGINAGVEYDNSTMAGDNVYHKGYIFPLTAEYVATHPELKGIYDVLIARSAIYKNRNGGVRINDLPSNLPTHLPYAYHLSADKVNENQAASYESFNDTEGNKTTMRDHFTLEGLASGNMNNINTYLDKIYYGKNEEFIGISGENFGIQQVMDKDTTESIMSVQLARAIGANAGVNGMIEVAEGLQGKLTELMQMNLKSIEDTLNNGSASEIREMIKKGMNIAEMDPIQAMSIVNDKLSFNTPELRIIARNQLANIVRMKGNKLKTPGAVLQQRPSHYKNPHGNTNGGDGLSFYSDVSEAEIAAAEKYNTMNINGKDVRQDHNNIKTTTRKMEAIVSSNLDERVEARKYFTFKNVRDWDLANKYPGIGGNREEMLLAMRDAAFGVATNKQKNVGVVFGSNNQVIGFYVEGDTIMTTRIPAHGPQTTGVAEVIGFDGLESSNIELPQEFALGTSGGDFDGDQIFLQHGYPKFGEGSKHKNKKIWNSFMKDFESYWLTPEMQTEVKKHLNHKEKTASAKKAVAEQFPEVATATSVFGTPAQRRKDFANTLSTAESIGIVANAHGLIGMLATYGTDLLKGIKINGQFKNTFQDLTGKESRTINSANLFNIVLDNAKDQSAEILGINKETAVASVILTNLGFNLDEIALILNSDVVKEFVQIKSNKENVFSTEKRSNIIKALKKKFGYNKNSKDVNDINTSDINTKANIEAIIDLLQTTENINTDLMRVNGVMSQHNSIEINPFELRNQINDFDNALDNVGNASLNIPEGFKNNPLVTNYRATVEVMRGYQEKIDPVYRESSSALYEEIVEGTPYNLTKEQRQHVYNLVELFHTARSMGYNNLPKSYLQSLTEDGNANNLFDRLENYMSELDKNLVVFDKNNKNNDISELDHNLLLRKLINFHSKGNNKFISLNTGYFKENISPSLRNRAISEFEQLPTSLKNDIILYDLMTNKFKSGKSLFPIFSRELRNEISVQADLDIVGKNQEDIPEHVMQSLMQNILSENSGMVDQTRGGKELPSMFKKNTDGSFELKLTEIAKYPKIEERMMNNEPFFIKQKNGIYHIKGGEAVRSTARSLGGTKIAAAKAAMTNYTIYPINDSNYNEGIISIPDNNKGPYYDATDNQSTQDWDSALKKKVKSVPGRRYVDNSDTNYYKYEQTLSKQEFDGVQHYDKTISKTQRQTQYEIYLRERKEANDVYLDVNENSVKGKTFDELNALYAKYGVKGKFAYTNVLNPITFEMAQRVAEEQARYFAEKGVSAKGVKGEDINGIQKWLMSNNIPSNQPGVQGAVRTMERTYKQYQEERIKYTQKINKATNALYKEKYGYTPTGGGVINKLKIIFAAVKNLFNREAFYKNLYGNLLIETKGKDVVTGKEALKLKYKPEEQINEEYKNGKITKGEYDFYTTTREISKELEPYVTKEKKSRADYVPHVAPDLMERLSRRGLLGALVHGKSVHQQIYDVKMDFVNPVTGVLEVNQPFKYIEDIYNAVSVDKKADPIHSVSFFKLKRKANVLYKEGTNENGTAIEYSKITLGTAIGDVFMNDFQGENGVKAQDLPSYDLNKAFTDYTDSALYTFGNANFTGMKNLLPIVDGLLLQASRDQNPKLEKYIDKIWRQYFLSGKKQKIKYNSNTLLAAGVASDDVIDFITKGSLIYWLGFKGLAIGGGAYAIGNVLVGKYHNLKNAGGKAFALGEKRYWMGKEGKMNLLDPLKGTKEAQEILKNLGFLDINIYDEVGIHKKTSLDTMLSGLALMPMIRSEKWIQGSHFLGLLTDKEWDLVKDEGKLSEDRLNELEEEVKTSHGKGYQPTDQRMLQMYSWGRLILQFSRYLPTMAYDRMAKKDINRYGRLHMGSYVAMYEPIQKIINGEMSTKDFVKYYRELEPDQKKRFDSGIIGFGFMATLLGIQQIGIDNKYADDLYWDANSLVNFDKLQNKLKPAGVAMIDQLTNF